MDAGNLADIRSRNEGNLSTEASGYRISRTLVLTARHAVVDETGRSFERIEVRLGPPGPNQVKCLAAVLWTSLQHDAALLSITPAAPDRRLPRFVGPSIQWGAFQGVGQVMITGSGFPRYAEYDGDDRKVDQISAEVSPLSMGSERGTFPIPVHDPPSVSLGDALARPWQGFSGSAIFTTNPPGSPSGAYRRLLVGVVVADDLGFEYRRIHALRVADLIDDAGFTRCLKADGIAQPNLVLVQDHNDEYLRHSRPQLTILTANAAWAVVVGLEAAGYVLLRATLGPEPSLVYGGWVVALTIAAWIVSLAVRRLRTMRRRFLAGMGRVSEADLGFARVTKLRTVAESLRMSVLSREARNQTEALAIRGTEQVSPADLPYSILDGGGGGTVMMIDAHFAELDPQRLIILGGPGSGKTVLATHLLLRLGSHEHDIPLVPLLVSLANWAQISTPGPTGSLAEFVALQIHVDYGITMADARDLVRLGWVLPVLDGLDEMDRLPALPVRLVTSSVAPRAALAIEKINAYCQEFGNGAQLVVTCRDPLYDLLPFRIIGAARIRIEQMDADRIRSFVEPVIRDWAHSAQWGPVLEDLQANASSPAIEELRTPWRLTLALAASSTPTADETRYLFEPEALIVQSAKDSQADKDRDRIKDELLGHFATALLSRRQARMRASMQRERASFTVPDDRTLQHWLHGLAGYLAAYGGTKLSETETISTVELNLHTMWPVAGRHTARLIHLCIHLICAMLFIVPVTLAVLGRPTDAAGTVAALTDGMPIIDPTTAKRLVLLAAAAVVLLVWATWLALTSSPRRSRTKSAGFRSQAMRRMGAVARLVAAVEITIAIGGAFALLAYLMFGLAAAVVTGVLVGSSFALVMDKVRLDRGLTGGFDAWTAWRNEVGLGVALGVLASLLFDLFLEYPWWSGAVFGFVLGFSGAFVLSLQAWLRYTIAMTVMKLRKQLPWRLGAFLFWGQQVGLFRISGTGYQYRHDELREWYERHSFQFRQGRDDPA